MDMALIGRIFGLRGADRADELGEMMHKGVLEVERKIREICQRDGISPMVYGAIIASGVLRVLSLSSRGAAFHGIEDQEWIDNVVAQWKDDLAMLREREDDIKGV